MDWLSESTRWIREQIVALPWWSDPVRSTIERVPDWAIAATALALIITLAALAAAPRHRPRRPVERVTSTSAAIAATPNPSSGARARGVTPGTIPDDEDRTARIFVSSAFLDMHGERDVLVRKTFPALRAAWRAKGVDVFEVDLRWGVTEDQVKQGRLLPIILSEIDRCNYFIAVLGDRYGREWTDDEIDEYLRNTFPALANAAGLSLTEIEIVHAVLTNPAKAKRALFFLRDPAWAAALDQAARTALGVEPGAAQDKLAALKSRIEQSGADVIGYADPQDLSVKVEAALNALLAADFSAAEAPDAFTQAQRLNSAYARERLGLHVGADPYVAALDNWVDRDAAKPVLITGASGGGKSTLIANWLSKRRTNCPGDIIFEHYLGASPDSADPALLVRRLWEALNRTTGDSIEAPTEERGLFDALTQRLAQASALAASKDGRIFIALDGLDKLTRQQDLRWLPQFLPPRVKLLASALEGDAQSAALARGWEQIAVKPLATEQQRLFIKRTLLAWGRELSQSRMERILAHRLAANPLFLKTVLDELRVSGIEEALDERLDFYLNAATMPELFARLLQRLESDCAPGLVAKALPLIWASRAGLEESEIIAIAAAAPLDWAQLRNSLGDALRDQQGRLAFSHDFLRQAVETRSLGSDEKKRAAHLTIADRFEALPADARQAEELPFQLRAAEDWDRLEALLVDFDRFALLRQRGDGDLLAHWLPLKERERDPETLMCGAFEMRAGEPRLWSHAEINLAAGLGHFLRFTGATGNAHWRLHEQLSAACERLLGLDNPSTLETMNNLAQVLSDRGDLLGAQKIQEQVLEARKRILGPDHPSTLNGINNLAQTLLARGDLERAQACHERALDARARNLGPDHPDTLQSMNNLAQTLFTRGDLVGAQTLFERVVDRGTRRNGAEHPDTLISMDNLATTLNARGDWEEARAIEERALEAMTRVLGMEHPSTLTSLLNLSSTLASGGNLEAAQAIQERVVEARTRLLGLNHPDTTRSINSLIVTLCSRGDLARALVTQERVLARIAELLGATHPDAKAGAENVAAIKAAMLRRAT